MRIPHTSLNRLGAGALTLACVAGCGPISSGGSSRTRTVITTLAEGLNNPTAALLRADGTLVVAESGAGQLVTVDAEGSVTVLVDGFAVGTFTPFAIGPLSVIAAADGSLIVGEGGERIGRERISFYTADGTLARDPIVPVGGSDFFDLAVDPATGDLYIASTGSDRVYVAAPAAAGGFDTPVEYVPDTTVEPIGATAPSALAFDADGRLLVGFADLRGGKIVALTPGTTAGSLVVEVLVNHVAPITSIAIRPSDNAIVFAQRETSGSGDVSLLDADGRPTTLVNGLDGPTDIVFDAEGTLYATLLGDPDEPAGGSVIAVEFVEISTNGAAEADTDTTVSTSG